MNVRKPYETDFLSRTLAPVLNTLRADPSKEASFIVWAMAQSSALPEADRPSTKQISRNLWLLIEGKKPIDAYMAVLLIEFARKGQPTEFPKFIRY